MVLIITSIYLFLGYSITLIFMKVYGVTTLDELDDNSPISPFVLVILWPIALLVLMLKLVYQLHRKFTDWFLKI